ncbi:hypothetical protein EYF80_005193 [Liparis tanakae]|uniref:Uncharacterized protein n=1 Tax=Liparis tanakae TaxID=230148 RepID=A0A4Z2J4S4_9TELE|nr:hypothetical protein EYF80_005193 [Liparis tanakae]
MRSLLPGGTTKTDNLEEEEKEEEEEEKEGRGSCFPSRQSNSLHLPLTTSLVPHSLHLVLTPFSPASDHLSLRVGTILSSSDGMSKHWLLFTCSRERQMRSSKISKYFSLKAYSHVQLLRTGEKTPISASQQTSERLRSQSLSVCTAETG